MQLSTVRLSTIGTIITLNEDGTIQQAPIPGLGGSYDTAEESFQAWAGEEEIRHVGKEASSSIGGLR